MGIITLPKLDSVTANITGILPLAALIDFTDPEQILHFYQLSGQGLVCNWVITPACARLIVSRDGTGACCLDQGSAVPSLLCLDGYCGDLYYCSNPRTIRACMEAAVLEKIKIDPLSREQSHVQLQRVQSQLLRPHRLRIILVSPAKNTGPRWDRLYRAWMSWFFFLVFLVSTTLLELYLATSYVIVVLLTGVVIHFSYGHHVRKIAKQMPPLFRRLVVVADNFNKDEWTAFIGPNVLLNPLLNKPLQQVNPPTPLRLWILQWVLFALVALQWGLTIIASGHQDLNAYMVFVWIGLSSVISWRLYSGHWCVRSWLQSNGLWLKRIDVELNFQRSMLTLLVALNPDTSIHTSSGQKWIDPILAPCDQDRIKWEKALLGCLQKDGWDERIRACYGSGLDVLKPDPYWKFILEGLEMAKCLQSWLEENLGEMGQPENLAEMEKRLQPENIVEMV